MEEDNEKKEGKTEPVESGDNGNTPETLDKVERAELAVKRIEDGEKRLDEKIKQLQDLQAERLLGGTAGARVEPETKEETPKEYAEKIMSGKYDRE